MNMLCHDDQTLRLLNLTSRKSWIIVRFFFDFRAGPDIPNNLEGAFRSFNFQLVRDGTAIEHEQTSDMDRFDRGSNDQWSEEELKQSFLKRIRKRTANVMIFIDGLDECEGDSLGLLHLLKNLPSAEKDPSLVVKVCAASRPAPLFQQTLKGFPRLQMESHNFDGIEEYASTVMRSLNPSASDVEWRERMPRLIAERAEGVFLWAVFAVKEMAQSYVEGERPEALRETLNGLPSDLGDLYGRTLSRLDGKKQRTAAAMFQLISSARRDIRLEELIMASDILCEVPQTYNQRLDENLRSALRRRISAVSGGLLEVVSCDPYVATARKKWVVERELALSDQQQEGGHSDAALKRRSSFSPDLGSSDEPPHDDVSNPEIVRVIHQTVETYLDISGFLQQNRYSHADKLPMLACWFQVCCKHLRDVLEDISQIRVTNTRGTLFYPSLEDLANQYWLVKYASFYIFEHARDVQTDLGLSSYPLMKGLINHGLTDLHDSCAWCESGLRMGADENPWLLPLLHGLHLFCADAVRDGRYASHTEHNSVFYATVSDPYIVDVAPQSETNRLYDLFIERGERFGIDSVIYSLQECSATMLLETLISSSSDRLIFRSGDGTEYGALYFLVHNRRTPGLDLLDKIEILLEMGEDLNTSCGPAGTVLHTVIKGELCGFSVPLTKTLLDLGADPNASGPYGTTLQLAWDRARTGLLSAKESRILQRLVRLLLDSPGVQANEEGALRNQLLDWMNSDHMLPVSKHHAQHDDKNSCQTSSDAYTKTSPANPLQKMMSYAWIKRCLTELVSSTPSLRDQSIQTTASKMSICYGSNDPQARSGLGELYDKVAEFRFCENSGVLSVNIYVRKSDRHAKILCVSPRSRSNVKLCCVALRSLYWNHTGARVYLQTLTDRGYEGEEGLNWATLQFDDFETAYLFTSTLSVLLGHDTTVQGRWQTRDLSTYYREIFGGVIVHNRVRHAFRVFLVNKSFARLEASIWSGDNRRSPVWTAFLTPKDEFNPWTIEALEGPFVKLNNVPRYYFADSYLGSKLETVGDVVEFDDECGKSRPISSYFFIFNAHTYSLLRRSTAFYWATYLK